METMLIELVNGKAVKLLYELEALHLIRVLEISQADKQKISSKYAGSLPGDIADGMQHYISESRNEWNSQNT